MKKLELKPGVTYRGSAILNEYGQVQFTAYQQGTKPSNLHTVLETPFFKLSESKICQPGCGTLRLGAVETDRIHEVRGLKRTRITRIYTNK